MTHSVSKSTGPNKKKLHISQGLLKAEMNEFFKRVFSDEGYTGLEVRKWPHHTEVLLHCKLPRSIIGEQGRTIRELTSLVCKRFGFEKNALVLNVNKLQNWELNAAILCQRFKYSIINGNTPKRASTSIKKIIEKGGALGYEITLSGKLRGQRAKTIKYSSGRLIHSGSAVENCIDSAGCSIQLRQGVLGVKIKIMLPLGQSGPEGRVHMLPDACLVSECKEEASPDVSGLSGIVYRPVWKHVQAFAPKTYNPGENWDDEKPAASASGWAEDWDAPENQAKGGVQGNKTYNPGENWDDEKPAASAIGWAEDWDAPENQAEGGVQGNNTYNPGENWDDEEPAASASGWAEDWDAPANQAQTGYQAEGYDQENNMSEGGGQGQNQPGERYQGHEQPEDYYPVQGQRVDYHCWGDSYRDPDQPAEYSQNQMEQNYQDQLVGINQWNNQRNGDNQGQESYHQPKETIKKTQTS